MLEQLLEAAQESSMTEIDFFASQMDSVSHFSEHTNALQLAITPIIQTKKNQTPVAGSVTEILMRPNSQDLPENKSIKSRNQVPQDCVKASSRSLTYEQIAAVQRACENISPTIKLQRK